MIHMAIDHSAETYNDKAVASTKADVIPMGSDVLIEADGAGYVQSTGKDSFVSACA